MIKIAIIDLETTGFLGSKGKIVEIGIVELDLTNGKTKILLDKRCKEPGLTAKDRDAWIFKNSSLTVEEVREAPTFDYIKPEIQAILDLYPVTAYNNVFDFGFIENRGVKIKRKLACPMKIATNVCRIEGPRGWKWPNVEEAWKFFFPNIPYVEEHRGADDAVHEAAIVYELYKLGLFKI